MNIDNLNNIFSIFQKWDATNYVNLIDKGYLGYEENGENIFLVFFPLYIWLVRPFSMLLGNTEITGSVISSIFFSFACCMIYKLVLINFSKRVAKYTIIFLSLYPFSFFFGSTMTESLFLLTTSCSLYYLLKHKWWLFALWGTLSALTRMIGVLVIVPALIEIFTIYFNENKYNRKISELLRKIFISIVPIVGTFFYLLLNKFVDNNWFAFITHQKHWYQGFMWISKVLQYNFTYLKQNYNSEMGISIWYPNLIIFLVCFLLILFNINKKIPDSLIIYSFIYLIINYSLSWLLSAGRYMSCGIPFFIFLSSLFDKLKNAKIAIIILESMLLVIYLGIYISGGPVM